MANASIIGRPERTPSLGYTKDRKRFTDFGASARRADGKPEGGDVLELQVRVNAAQDGMSKSETMRQIARQLIDEATQALESAVHSGEQPPAWIQAMSPAGWERYHHLREESEAVGQSAIPQTEQAACFSPGQQDTWLHTPRGGYGSVIPVDVIVVKVNQATVTIRVQKRDGSSRELCVQPTSLHIRTNSQEPTPHIGGSWFVSPHQ